MNRTLILSAPLFCLLACQSQSLDSPGPPDSKGATQAQLPAVTVNDPCATHTTAATCQNTKNLCAWTPVDACPAGASCPAGVCVTIDFCASLTTAAACQSDASCTWSAIAGTTAAPALCPVGQDCGGGGFCFARASSGGTCLCVQPVACPARGACPPVQCDCPPPTPVDAGGGAGGGGTCTCGCPACAPGEPCAQCDCACGTGGTGGGAGCGSGSGGATGTGGGPGTCTCNCPECGANADCIATACSCSCSNGTTTTMTAPTASTSSGAGAGGDSAPVAVCGCPACPAGTSCPPCGCGATPAADPCFAHTDAASCAADTTDACGWTSLNIECVTTPCPTGSCARVQPGSTVDAGINPVGGGCACACPACAPGEACPPCACNCCPALVPPPVTLQPQPVGVDGGAAPQPAAGASTPRVPS